MTRGIKQNRDLFVKFMETQMFNWKTKDLKTGKDVWQTVQGALRPVELWEYVFPEESLGEVLEMLKINPKNQEKYGNLSQSLQLKTLRKMLNAEPIPEDTELKQTHFVFVNGMGIHPIGIKKDEFKDVKEWNRGQEML